LIGDYEISCVGDDVDVYARLLAVCSLSGVDLNRTMVAEGWATAFRRYSEIYVVEETRARSGRLGLWASNFVAPEDYRQQQDALASSGQPTTRAPVRQARSVAGQCLIKGNRGRNGWIYHLPGRPYYAETRAEEWFCSEAEAQAAGYRRSKA
jgi:hypothetical protein